MVSAFFIAWLLFFDSNDVVTQITLSQKLSDLEAEKSYYEERIIEVEKDREALMNNADLLEKMAREKYFMRKPGEDVFVIAEEK